MFQLTDDQVPEPPKDKTKQTYEQWVVKLIKHVRLKISDQHRAREVTIYDLKLLPTNDKGEGLPSFGLDVECGGGTYIRSLVRDIGRELNTCATMTSLVRTQQAQFLLDNTVEKDDLSADTIFAAIDKTNSEMNSNDEDSKPDESS